MTMKSLDQNQSRYGAYTDLEFFAYKLDLRVPWTASLYTFSTAVDDWHLRGNSSIAVVPVVLPGVVTTFTVWHGSQREQESRRAAAKASRATRKAGPRKRSTPHGNATKPSKPTKRRKQLTDKTSGDTGNDNANAIVNSDNDNEEDTLLADLALRADEDDDHQSEQDPYLEPEAEDSDANAGASQTKELMIAHLLLHLCLRRLPMNLVQRTQMSWMTGWKKSKLMLQAMLIVTSSSLRKM